jgi:glyoxylase-like metal-dependent hydrolase (beta-lactamase superfamily II)
MLNLKRLALGSFQTNCYLLDDPESGTGILVDPGAEPARILNWIGAVTIEKIIITHGHSDHVGALAEVRASLACPVGGHQVDADAFGLHFDFTLGSGDRVELGSAAVEIHAIPGHTPGSIALALDESVFRRAIVGDAIFPGGPGRTQSHEDLKQLLDALAVTVFTWPDEVVLHPGHGEATTVGDERMAFERFRKQTLPTDIYGDVTWR